MRHLIRGNRAAALILSVSDVWESYWDVLMASGMGFRRGLAAKLAGHPPGPTSYTEAEIYMVHAGI
jgi:hypothetical protein